MDSVWSIQNQTYKDWELYILNGDNQDIGEYTLLDKRIKVVQSPVKDSAENMINNMAKAVDCEYIMQQYADCISLPQRMELQIKAMEEKKVDLVTSIGITFFPNNTRQWTEVMSHFNRKDCDVGNSPSFMWRKQVLVDVPYRSDVRYWSDITWVMDFQKTSYKHYRIKVPLYYRHDRDARYFPPVPIGGYYG